MHRVPAARSRWDGRVGDRRSLFGSLQARHAAIRSRRRYPADRCSNPSQGLRERTIREAGASSATQSWTLDGPSPSLPPRRAFAVLVLGSNTLRVDAAATLPEVPSGPALAGTALAGIALMLVGCGGSHPKNSAAGPTTTSRTATTSRRSAAAKHCRSDPHQGVHDANRLKVIDPCATFAATVIEAAELHRNDGDVAFWVAPDH